MAENTIDKLQLEMTSSSADAENALKRLKNSLKTLKQIGDSIGKIEGVSQLTEMASAINAIADAGNNSGLAEAVKQLRKLSKTDFSGIAKSSSELKQIADNVNNVKTSMDGIDAEKVDISDDIKKSDRELDTMAKDMARNQRLLGRLAEGFKNLPKAAKNAVANIKTSFAALKRVAFYRLVRSAIKLISDAVKEGIHNLALYDNAMGNIYGYNKALSDLKSKWTQLSNTFGVFAGNIIALVAPALIKIIDVIMSVIDAVDMLIAVLKGEDHYLRANRDYWQNYAEGLNKSNGNAKKLQRTLLGFDEINRLNDSNSGGNSTTPDVSNMFERVDLGDGGAWDKIKTGFLELAGIDPFSGAVAGAGAFVLAASKVVSAIEKVKGAYEGLKEKLKEKTNSAKIIIEPAVDFAPARQAMVLGGLELQRIWKGVTLPALTPQVIITVAVSGITALATIVGTKWNEIKEKTSEVSNNVKEQMGIGFNNAKQVVVTWTTETANRIVAWGTNVAGNVRLTLSNVATNIHAGLQTTANNVVDWVNGTSSAVAEWGKGFISAAATVAKNFASKFTEGLKSAWQKFKEFAKATGETISNTFSGGDISIPVGAVAIAGLTVGAIALASGAGFAALPALAAFADGGTVPRGDLFIANENGAELVGNIGGKTTVNNQDQFLMAMENVEEGTRQAIISVGNAIVTAINSQDYGAKVTIGDRDIVRAYDRGRKLVGKSLIEG